MRFCGPICNLMARKRHPSLLPRSEGTVCSNVADENTQSAQLAKFLGTNQESSEIPIEVMAHDRIQRRPTTISLPDKEYRTWSTE